MKQDFTKPDTDLDVFCKAATAHGLFKDRGEKSIDPVGSSSTLKSVTLSYSADTPVNTDDLLRAFAGMLVELAEYPVGMDMLLCREVLMRVRASLDRLYPSSVWPDTTTEMGGRFAWAIRARIARRLQDLQDLE